jgi:hypothetical protein
MDLTGYLRIQGGTGVTPVVFGVTPKTACNHRPQATFMEVLKNAGCPTRIFVFFLV